MKRRSRERGAFDSGPGVARTIGLALLGIYVGAVVSLMPEYGFVGALLWGLVAPLVALVLAIMGAKLLFG